MKKFTVRSATPDDIPGIIDLHAQNMPKEGQDLSSGYVFWRPTREELEQYLHYPTSIIAESDEVEGLAGYVYTMSMQYANIIGSKKPSFTVMDNTEFDGRPLSDFNTCFGQVCASADLRGHGVPQAMYEELMRVGGAYFDLRVIDVISDNKASFRFHRDKMKLPIAREYQVGERSGYVFVLDLRQRINVAAAVQEATQSLSQDSHP